MMGPDVLFVSQLAIARALSEILVLCFFGF